MQYSGTPMNHRRRALGLTAAFACAAAVSMHTVLHALLDGAEALSATHFAELTLALAILALAVVAAGATSARSERRRRLALIRAALPRSTGALLTIALCEAAVTSGLFGAEGAIHSVAGLGVALGCGALGFVLTLVCMRAGHRPEIAILCWFAALIASDSVADAVVSARRLRPQPLGITIRRSVRLRAPPRLLPTA